MKNRLFVLLALATVAVAAVCCWSWYSRHQGKLAPKPGMASASPAPSAGGRAGRPTVAASNAAVAAATGTSPVPTREFDLSVNPYAAALREPGRAKRPWPAEFLANLNHPSGGEPIRFELTGGRFAIGTIGITQYREGALVYLSGELTEPEAGKFFFLEPPAGGKAGKAVGVIEFPASGMAYRLEPTGPNGDPELWQRRLDEVLCVKMPAPPEAAGASALPPAEMPPLRPDAGSGIVPSYNSNIVSLQSYPGSSAVLLLDFFGGYTPTWGGVVYSRPTNVNNATIRDLWKRVAEDYQPFNINVTTDLKVYQAAPAASRQRCCFTDTPITAAGVAYIGSWNWGSDTPCWSVYTTGKSGAEVGAHEPGHTLGLGHQGSVSGTNTTEYYTGQGSGATGWAPIMGAGYYQPVTTWAKGEYQYANNTQDELKVIVTQNNNVAYRPDDTGDTLATARYLDLYLDGGAMAEGVIERTDDTDAFRFSTSGGQVSLTASPVGDWADLAVMVTLADADDTVIASNNPQSTLWATITSNLPAGTYTFRVTGASRNNPFINGFTAYSSLGYYSVVGSVEGGQQPTRLSVFEHVPIGTAIGSVPAQNTNDTWGYAIVAGNTGTTFAIDNAGIISVADNSQLDYDRLATNTVLAVQFELFVNLTNLDNPDLTELNRRVVIEVLKTSGSYPIAASGFNAGVIVPYNATTASPAAKAFDIANNWCFYQAGLNGNAQVGGTGGLQGLPVNGTLVSRVDGATFQLGPYGGTNALLLGYTYPKWGTLTLLNPQPLNSLAILASSANGGGLGTFVITFTNGTRSPVISLNAQDWYNTTTNIALQGFGRVRLGQSTLTTENPGWNNPNLYQTTVNLAGLGLNQAVASITFTNPTTGGTQNSGILGLSGALMPAEVSITQQPQATTNLQPALSASFKVVAMGTPPLAYQWYFSASGSEGTFVSLEDQTNSTLVLNPTIDVTNAGWYQAVVTNGISAATSTAARLKVWRTPAITQQPTPANLVLLTGMTNTFSVTAEAALPVSYFWMTNGVAVPGANARTFTRAKLTVADSAIYSVLVSNAFGSVASSAVSLTVVAVTNTPYTQAVLTDRPMAYWRLDEKSGSIAHDYVSGLNGSFNNTLLGQSGYSLLDTHTAVRFGVLAANNSYVGKIPLNFATLSSAAFSVEAWVNGGTQSSDNGIVTKGTGAGGEQFNLDCGASSHAFRFFVRDAGGTAHLANSTVVPNGKWHHLVGVCDQVHSNVFLYVDGTNVAKGTINPDTGIKGSTNFVTFGSRQSGSATAYDLQFLGSMEEVAIYNYALSSNQVRAHFIAVTNRPPVFRADPFAVAAASAGHSFSTSIWSEATDPNNDTLTYSKISGPAWLTVSGNGALSGTPANLDAGTNAFVVRAADTAGLSSSATMTLEVIPSLPITSTASLQGTDLLLSWTGGIPPYQVQVTTNLAAPDWQDLGFPTETTNLLLSPSNSGAWYRIRGQ